MMGGDIHPNMLVTTNMDWRQKVVVHVFRRDLDGCPMALCAWLDDYGQLRSTDLPVACLSRAGPDTGDDADVNERLHTA